MTLHRRVLRFLFALPVALAATGALATSPLPRPDQPESENSYVRADRAAEQPPSVDIADEDQPKFPGLGGPAPDRDVQPAVRVPPRYPEKCMAAAKPQESVFIEFDVAPDGSVANMRVLHSTNSCFNDAAATSVASWKYNPKLDASGNPAWRRGVQTAITFELAGDVE